MTNVQTISSQLDHKSKAWFPHGSDLKPWDHGIQSSLAIPRIPAVDHWPGSEVKESNLADPLCCLTSIHASIYKHHDFNICEHDVFIHIYMFLFAALLATPYGNCCFLALLLSRLPHSHCFSEKNMSSICRSFHPLHRCCLRLPRN